MFRLLWEFTWLLAIVVLLLRSNPPSFWIQKVFILAHGVVEQGRRFGIGVNSVLLFVCASQRLKIIIATSHFSASLNVAFASAGKRKRPKIFHSGEWETAITKLIIIPCSAGWFAPANF